MASSAYSLFGPAHEHAAVGNGTALLPPSTRLSLFAASEHATPDTAAAAAAVDAAPAATATATATAAAPPASADAAAEAAAARPAAVRNWNAEFQRLTHANPQTYAAQQGIARELTALVDEYTQEAARIAAMIVDDLALPTEQRRLQPVAVGGIAGGEKYMCDGIFFKLALDFAHIYGSDALAMKAASLEFRNTLALDLASTPNLSHALLAVVDYRGHRLVCVPKLPISRDTIVYGSCDGGITVHGGERDAEAVEAMQQLAFQLRLKPHLVPDGEGRLVEIIGPGDIEVHRGHDGRLYILDVARLFAPMTPDRPSDVFTRQFRYEYLRREDCPLLCSDAYSGWGRNDIAEHNRDVDRLTQVYLQQFVPNQARAVSAAHVHNLVNERKFSSLFKLSGINMRHVGLFAQHASGAVGRIAINLVVARALKHMARSDMRTSATEVLLAGGTPAAQSRRAGHVCAVINGVIVRFARNEPAFMADFETAVRELFTMEWSQRPQENELQFSVVVPWLLQKLGLSLKPGVVERFCEQFAGGWPLEPFLSDEHVLEFKPLVQYPPFVTFHRAIVQAAAASKVLEDTNDVDAAIAKFRVADESFRIACARHSTNPDPWETWGVGVLNYGRMLHDRRPLEAFQAYQRSVLRLCMSLDVGPHRSSPLTNLMLVVWNMGTLVDANATSAQSWPNDTEWDTTFSGPTSALGASMPLRSLRHSRKQSDYVTVATNLYNMVQADSPSLSNALVFASFHRTRLLDPSLAPGLREDSLLASISALEFALQLFDQNLVGQSAVPVPMLEFEVGTGAVQSRWHTRVPDAELATALRAELGLLRLQQSVIQPRDALANLQAAYDNLGAALPTKGNSVALLDRFAQACMLLGRARQSPQFFVQAAQVYSRAYELSKFADHVYFAGSSWLHAAIFGLQDPSVLRAARDTLLTFETSHAAQSSRQVAPLLVEVFNRMALQAFSQAELMPPAMASSRAALLAEAEASFLEAEKRKPGAGAYNLACLAALRGDEARCREMLETAARHGGMPPLAHVRQDAQLARYQRADWFRRLVSEA